MARMLILEGDSRSAGTALDCSISALAAEAEARGDTWERLRLADLHLQQCVGCFDCWLKTPGRCRMRDGGPTLHAALAIADVVVLASPLRMGFTSALLKRACDRVIPSCVPYLEMIGGECHHRSRYGRHPDLGLLLERCDATDDEIAATEEIYRRMALNLCGKLAWVRFAGPTAAAAAQDPARATQ
jgi:hypothetical protein